MPEGKKWIFLNHWVFIILPVFCSQLKFDRFILIILVDNNSDVGVKVRDVRMFVLLY